MDDHDQRFKNLLRQELAAFVSLFFPDWAAKLDLSHPEWLEQELFLDPPQGEKVEADLIARVPAREALPVVNRGAGEQWLVLIHVEVESRDTSEPIKPRMFEFYHTLRRNHGLPVLPIVLFLSVGRDGLGWDAYEERLWGRTLLRYEYPYVGLPALDGEAYIGGENLLGVALAALMRLPKDRQAVLKAEAMDRIRRGGESEQRRRWLAECLEAYFPLHGPQAQEFSRLIRTGGLIGRCAR